MEPASQDASKRRRILVMDDEPMIQAFIRQILATLGYEVEVASRGEEAVALYQQALAEGQRYDLVILDLTIPVGLDGPGTLEELYQIDPRVKAVATSGYANDPIMLDPVQYRFAASLKKPYRLSELQDLLNRLLPGNDPDHPTAFNRR